MSSLEAARTSVRGTSKEEGKVFIAKCTFYTNINNLSFGFQPLCENFAMSLFMRAEEEERSGNITGATAKQFYAAALMFDVMDQFGDVDQEVVFSDCAVSNFTQCTSDM